MSGPVKQATVGATVQAQIAPVPTTIIAEQVLLAGQLTPTVLLRVATPVGLAAYFMSPQDAKALGEHLVKLGQAETIVLAALTPHPQ